MLTGRQPSHSNSQTASSALCVVASDGQGSGRNSLTDDAVIDQVPPDGAMSADQPGGIDYRLGAGNRSIDDQASRINRGRAGVGICPGQRQRPGPDFCKLE